MHKIVISDTSCLIILHKIGELDILRKVYESVTTTPEVAVEFLEIKLKDYWNSWSYNQSKANWGT